MSGEVVLLLRLTIPGVSPVLFPLGEIPFKQVPLYWKSLVVKERLTHVVVPLTLVRSAGKDHWSRAQLDIFSAGGIF